VVKRLDILVLVHGYGRDMYNKIKHWKQVCALHWKEIISLAVALHWLMDLLIVIPISLAIGYLFGITVSH
jgi:hypothetical protein